MRSLREEIAHTIYEEIRKRKINAELIRDDRYSTVELRVYAWSLPINVESIFREINCRVIEKKEDEYSADYLVVRGNETTHIGVVYLHRENDYDRYCTSLGMCRTKPEILILIY